IASEMQIDLSVEDRAETLDALVGRYAEEVKGEVGDGPAEFLSGHRHRTGEGLSTPQARPRAHRRVYGDRWAIRAALAQRLWTGVLWCVEMEKTHGARVRAVLCSGLRRGLPAAGR